jgi:hypothetical protein
VPTQCYNKHNKGKQQTPSASRRQYPTRQQAQTNKKGWYLIMMYKTVFTIGLNDKDTEQQKIESSEAKILLLMYY